MLSRTNLYSPLANARIYGSIHVVCVALLAFFLIGSSPILAQNKTHSKKLEKVKKKKKKKVKGTKYQGKMDPSTTQSVKGNPTKKSKKTSGKNYQQRIGNNEPPRGTKGTKFGGKSKASKSMERGKGTRHRGDPVPTEQRIAGNPTKKKRTSGEKYQQRIGNNDPPRGTKGTNFRGRGRTKTVNATKGTNYKGEVVPSEPTRVKGNPTKKIDRGGKAYRERTGQQGPPTNTPGTRFAGKGSPKTIKGGKDGTTYAGQSTAGSTSNSGGRTTIYGERGRNFSKKGVPEIKRQEQGTQWQGNLKGNKNIEGTVGTQFKGNLKLRKKVIRDYGGDWSGDLKVKDRRFDNRASTYTIKGMRPKEVAQGPGTTFRGNLKGSKKIVNWDGADYKGDLRVKRNPKIKTEGTTFAGHLKVKPNARVKTPGTRFAGHYKVSTNPKIKTEGVDFQGNQRIATKFSKNRYYRKKSREQQLFAGNYKVRRTKGKDLHPSATYSGGRLKDPNKRDDFSRKWKLLLAKTQKNADQPKNLKVKSKKPKYDPKQKDLWYD